MNGLGNLLVGYDEPKHPLSGRYLDPSDKTGSHNVVIGEGHSYSSYGGLVAGSNNRISGPASSITGGYGNHASGEYSSVSGGGLGYAEGPYSSITAGWLNSTLNDFSIVNGGLENYALGKYSVVSGGFKNFAGGEAASISGGRENRTGSFYSTFQEVGIMKHQALRVPCLVESSIKQKVQAPM